MQTFTVVTVIWSLDNAQVSLFNCNWNISRRYMCISKCFEVGICSWKSTSRWLWQVKLKKGYTRPLILIVRIIVLKTWIKGSESRLQISHFTFCKFSIYLKQKLFPNERPFLPLTLILYLWVYINLNTFIQNPCFKWKIAVKQHSHISKAGLDFSTLPHE